MKAKKPPSPLLIHARPVHTTSSASPFSKDSEDQNYRGFLHLAILLLVVNMLRLVVENFQKYGVLLSIPGRDVPLSDLLYGLLAVVALGINMRESYFLNSRYHYEGVLVLLIKS